jgi:hypothetical protein
MSAQRSLTLSRLILFPSFSSIGCVGFELEEVCNDFGIRTASWRRRLTRRHPPILERGDEPKLPGQGSSKKISRPILAL